ncbi:unnamed protein product, partial [Choristocarpus tenellus]
MDTTDAPQMIEHIHKAVTFTPNDTRWVPWSARFVVTGIHPRAKGALVVYEMDKGHLKLVAERETSAGIKCCTFGASSFEERHLACGDYNGNLNVYDLDRNDAPVWSVKGHTQIINAIDGVGGPESSFGAPEIVS